MKACVRLRYAGTSGLRIGDESSVTMLHCLRIAKYKDRRRTLASPGFSLSPPTRVEKAEEVPTLDNSRYLSPLEPHSRTDGEEGEYFS